MTEKGDLSHQQLKNIFAMAMILGFLAFFAGLGWRFGWWITVCGVSLIVTILAGITFADLISEGPPKK